MTLGEYMSSTILMGDTSINGMTNHSANLVEAIVGEGNFTLEQLQAEVENKINETIVIQQDKQAFVPEEVVTEPVGTLFTEIAIEVLKYLNTRIYDFNPPNTNENYQLRYYSYITNIIEDDK